METGKSTNVEKSEAYSEQDFFRDYVGKKIIVDYLDGSLQEAKLLWVGKYTFILKNDESDLELIFKQSVKRLSPGDE